MNLVSDIITYVRRIIKTPSNQAIPDSLIIDYLNRFYTYDAPARLQLFELKTKYNFMLTPNVDRYNAPFNANGNLTYQSFLSPAYIDGAQANFSISEESFYKAYPRFMTNEQNDFTSNGGGNFTGNTTRFPIQRGFINDIPQNDNLPVTPPSSLFPGIWITANDSNGVQQVVSDSGTFDPTNFNVGILTGAGTGTVNYLTGAINVTFTGSVPNRATVNVDYYTYQSGRPAIVKFYDNYFEFRPIPDFPYLFEIDCYLTPDSFLSSSEALKFGYMSEWLARGAARKMLSDMGDYDQFAFYEPLFREQEMLVIRRTDRQNSVKRTPTIFSEMQVQEPYNITSNF
ncbi:MAG TPA: hypothetical protein VFX43_09405 [Chitinophagaceae bacterium]|nr:hypothetical protein [Chitinophagaceae bacterium]